ncbi:putative DNA primase [Pseudomonas phage MR6]|uniref:Putative DNA primase n=1 Tax=Pseudomonas phage MR5 TaxID=2711172 RepID=A0A6M3TCS2_9CAUD|nr:putative DNA primase [Pseudomonas phage MR5]QJD54846.1 putative DNA primase [Pseudomonas phage MR6]
MAIPPSEFVHHAKSLAVGQTGRFNHKCGPGKVLHVGNAESRYWCKCYRCHQGGVLDKTHATMTRIPDQKRFMPWPDDAKDLSQWPAYTQELLLKQLYTKGIDRQVMLGDSHVWYSEKQGRLLFGTRLGWLGRATRGQNPKWAGYGYPAPEYGAHPLDTPTSTVVLTEDYLSAMKVRWALQGVQGVTAQALLGTELRTRHLSDLLDAGVQKVVTFLDGDRAGRSGSIDVARRARGMGLVTGNVEPPEDHDPKDLHKEQILNLLGGAL